jgi:hypothetical protein
MSDQENSRNSEFSWGWAILLTVLAVLVGEAFQTTETVNDWFRLKSAIQGQDQAVAQATKIRSQFTEIVQNTAAQAAGGDQIAQGLIEELRRQGINVAPSGPAK